MAGKTNPEAWALLLDDAFWEEVCPNRFRGASRELCRIIRFYISIEDGECTVERDFGEFRAQRFEHNTASMPFHEDCLIMRLNGPRSAAEFDQGIANPSVELTPFSRECASLWRELVGARRGHYNAAATRVAKSSRQKAPGFFCRAVRGVLVAARVAAASVGSTRERRAAMPALLHSGAGAA